MSLDQEHAKTDMSFLQHLEVLRWHLVRSAASIVILAMLAFANKSFVFDGIIFGPKSPDFWTFRQLCQLSAYLYEMFPQIVASADVLCIGQGIPKLQNINMAGQFTSHIMVSLIAGFVTAFPYIIWELWRFIKPGLNPKERKMASGLVFWVSILFALGILFGYFIISPLSINFLATYSISEQVQTIPTLSTYISTVTMVVLASGLLFELPILVFALTKLGLITPEFLRKYRRHFFVLALVVSAIITPPDVFSQLLVSVPLVILYEISIALSARIIKREAQND
jgi:sec-independent protein translocase protein TatC